MDTLTLIALAIVALMCIAGALSPSFPDNLLQRLGLAGTGISCVPLAEHVWRMHHVTPACALMVVGLVLYALGTAAKVLRFRPSKRCTP